MLKVGLLGAGRIGQVHAVNIAGHKESELVAVSDIDTKYAENLAAEYDASARTSEEIIGDNAIDAILIATSTDTHVDFIEAAAAAGKAVLCEKPVDLDLNRARACLDTVAGGGCPVMIGFNRRFDENFSALKTALETGEIGKAELLTITSFDPAPPPISYIEVSGGIFRDMMIHDFDMANFVMGVLPDTIHATASAIIDPEIGKAGDADTAVVTMKYEDGRIAAIKNSRRAVYGYDQRVEVLGSEGLLTAENVLENTVTKSTTKGVAGAKPTYFFLERYMRAYAQEWSDFVDVVVNKKEPPVGLADGIAALAMAEAAVRSTETGVPVSLNEI